MRIIFIGCVESSRRLLEKLLSNKKNIVGVITKRESLYNSDFYDLASICLNYDIPFMYAEDENTKSINCFMSELKPDIAYCFGWSKLIPLETLHIPSMGMVGFHPADLPKNRGRHPIIWALALGLEHTASTFFRMTEGADEGDILYQTKIKIDYKDDAKSLYDKIMMVAEKQVIELTDAFEANSVKIIPQDLTIGNTWRKRTKIDGQIYWRMSSRCIYNLVRALTKPYVGAHFVFKDMEYRVWKVSEIDLAGFNNIEPGKILSVNQDKTIDVKTGEGIVRLIEFENPGFNEGEYIL